jgi:hypothetical protein
MKIDRLAFIAVCAISLSSAAERGGGDPFKPDLDARDVQTYFGPYVASVRDCYAAHATSREADGTLRLELTIRPDGNLARFGFTAPGVSGGPLRRLDGCLRDLSQAWHFPVRRGFTQAVIPLWFQRAR